jgi:hypothetical protein
MTRTNNIAKKVRFLTLLLLVLPFILRSQPRVTETFRDTPLTDVLELIIRKYNVKLAYDNAIVQNARVSVAFRNASIDDVLREMLNRNGLDYVKVQGVYVIKVSVTPPEPKPPAVTKRVYGVVKEKTTGETLPYAAISVQGTNKETDSNPDGFFSIEGKQSDSVTLNISVIGFEPIQMRLAPTVRSDSLVVFELERVNLIPQNASRASRLGDRIGNEGKPGTFAWNSAGDCNPPTLSYPDIAAPLQFLPGIDGTTESLSGMMVRHSQADMNLISYDGFTIYHIDHFFGAFSSLNAKAIKDIRVIRGGFDARWGERASSVIELTGKTGNEGHFDADAGFDPLGVDVAMEGPVGRKATFIVAARRSFTDYYKSPLYYNLFESARSDLTSNRTTPGAFKYNPSDPKFLYYDINAKINLRPSQRDNISLSGYAGYDGLTFNKSDANPYIVENSNWGNAGVGMRWSRQWGSKFYHVVTLGGSQYNLWYDHKDSTIRRSMSGTVVRRVPKQYLIDNTLEDINVNILAQLRLGEYNNLEFGIAGNRVRIESFDRYSHYIYTTLSTTKIIDTARASYNTLTTQTAWLQNTFSYNSLKAIRIGARVTRQGLTGKVYIEPRAQLAIKPLTSLTLKLAAGVYHQHVNRVVTAGNGYYRNVWVVSDGAKYPVVRSKHLAGGLLWDLGNGFSADVEGYLKNTSGISFVQTTLKRSGNGPNAQVKQDKKAYILDSRVVGMDFLIKRDWQKGQVWMAYTLSRSANRSDQLNGGSEYPALDDQRHEIKLVSIYNLRHWSITASWVYGSGRAWDQYLFVNNVLSPDYSKNSARLDPYHRLDFGVSYTRKLRGIELLIGARAFNVYNHVNELAKTFQLPETLIDELGQGKTLQEIIGSDDYQVNYGMGFTPTLLVNLRF